MPYSFASMLFNAANNMVDTLSDMPATRRRPYPAQGIEDGDFTLSQKAHVAGLMRVNHAGEVCAQALYQGQALTARKQSLRDSLLDAAEEEQDHLHWCHTRLKELDNKTSVLNPFWYVGSYALGVATGVLGDRVSLGFVAEVEQQVHKHLQKHIDLLPNNDNRTKAILRVMQADEQGHREHALANGGMELPVPVRHAMSAVSKLMTATSYHL